MELRGRRIFPGKVQGKALVSGEPISFYGGVDPDTGIIEEEGHPLQGKSVNGRVLVFPRGKGSTVGSYTLYRMKKTGKAPVAILNRECETIVAVGAIIAEIPCMDQVDIEKIPHDALLVVDADNERIEVSEPPHETSS